MTFLSAASVHRSHFPQVDLDASELLQAVGGDVGTAPGAAGKKRTWVSLLFVNAAQSLRCAISNFFFLRKQVSKVLKI
jgi:hypothetical protein